MASDFDEKKPKNKKARILKNVKLVSFRRSDVNEKFATDSNGQIDRSEEYLIRCILINQLYRLYNYEFDVKKLKDVQEVHEANGMKIDYSCPTTSQNVLSVEIPPKPEFFAKDNETTYVPSLPNDIDFALFLGLPSVVKSVLQKNDALPESLYPEIMTMDSQQWKRKCKSQRKTVIEQAVLRKNLKNDQLKDQKRMKQSMVQPKPKKIARNRDADDHHDDEDDEDFEYKPQRSRRENANEPGQIVRAGAKRKASNPLTTPEVIADKPITRSAQRAPANQLN